MAEKFVEKHAVACYEADHHHIMRPTALLDLMQEAAGKSADTLGFGHSDMMQSSTTWVLSRTNVRFHSYPKWRDEVVLSTWHKGSNRLFYLRDFVLESADGERLATATTSWLIIDINTHRLVTSRNLPLLDSAEKCVADNAIEEPADKVLFPTDIEPKLVGTHKVAASDIDYVGHANNVKYVVWALDALDDEESLAGLLPKELLINYDAEVLKGDLVELYCVTTRAENELLCYVQGKVEGKTHFSMRFTFEVE